MNKKIILFLLATFSLSTLTTSCVVMPRRGRSCYRDSYCRKECKRHHKAHHKGHRNKNKHR